MAAYEGWAILEVMGHRRLAGFVSEVEMYGVKMCRIDVPSEPPATQFYGGGAIYCMTATTEEMARAVAKTMNVAPVQRWEMPQLTAPAPSRTDDTAQEEDAEQVPW